ncbi:hypothetical protein V490_00830 [Pseudogymnoascus sp. VKM F-3557]|nr:hypothetical protein V490_00830 [Pseudogymnoascus sp. VKM F-3557]
MAGESLPSSLPVEVATIQYLARDELYSTEKPYKITLDLDLDGPVTNILLTAKEVEIRDAQSAKDHFTLAINGFQFFNWDTQMSPEDFCSPELIKSKYFLELNNHLAEFFPAHVEIHFIGHKRRTSTLLPESHKEDGTDTAAPVTYAHSDFTPDGGIIRLKEFLEANPHLQGMQYELLNIWRVTRGPNNSWPLALCDYQSLSIPEDLEQVDVVHRDHVGESCVLYYNKNHKWYYLGNQEVQDVMVFRNTNSNGESIPFAPHTSFNPTSTSHLAPSRESIEVRAVVFY